MSLLTMIQGAARKIKVPQPTAVISSTDEEVLLLLELANEEGQELAKSFNWQQLTKEQTFTTVASQDQGALNSTVVTGGDFDRIVADTMWNRTQDRQVVGPQTSEEWQQDQSNATAAPPQTFRIWNGNLYIGPDTPSAGETVAFEYVSSHWCQSAASAGQAAWAADDDTGILPEDLMKLGVIWRYKEANGFAYAEDLETYERQKQRYQGQDIGSRRLFLGSGFVQFPVNIPDSNFPST